MVLDCYVLALDVARFAEAFAERGCIARGSIGRPAMEEPNYRQCLLLRQRRERPGERHAAE
jgi:hypothetical protein